MVPRPHRALKKKLGSDILGPLAMPWYVEKPIFCHGVGWFLGTNMIRKLFSVSDISLQSNTGAPAG